MTAAGDGTTHVDGSDGEPGGTATDPREPVADRAPLVVLDGVGKRYTRGGHDVWTVREVSLTVSAGDLLALSGPSGSGKTSVCHLVAALDRPDTGSVTWPGLVTDPGGGPPGWDQVAVVPQRLGLFDELTIGENLAAVGWLARGRAAGGRGTPPGRGRAGPGRDARDGEEDRAERLLEVLRLGGTARRLPREASLGEQQRAALARALVGEPALLVLDEPTAHQDDAGVEAVLGLLADAVGSGTAVLVATHDPRVEERAGRRVRMRDGRILT